MSHDHERLIHRAKIGHDNATPAGNGIAALALGRLGHLLGEPRFIEAAERTVKAFTPQLESQPGAHTSLCLALTEQLVPPTIVILHGDDATPWQRKLNAHFLPQTLALTIPPGAQDLPEPLSKPAETGPVNAWVCRGVNCLPPIADLGELISVLTTSAAALDG